MFNFKKITFILFLFIILVLFLANYCLAIDETQFSDIIQPSNSLVTNSETQNTNTNTTDNNSSITDNTNTSNPENNITSNPSNTADSTSTDESNTTQNTSIDPNSTSSQTSLSSDEDEFEDNESTKVSSVSASNPNGAMFTNILNIALISFGILLILFAVAILIKMHS